jgi:hypothetical protein
MDNQLVAPRTWCHAGGKMEIMLEHWMNIMAQTIEDIPKGWYPHGV